MKTLEEVKEHFKNANEIKSMYHYNETFKFSEVVEGHVGYTFMDKLNARTIYRKGIGFAEIISYKDNPIQYDDFNEYTKEIPVPVRDYAIDTPKHYDNSKGTLYKVANERNWNPYLFDIVKRLERADKKGEFESDLEKSINVIKLWLKESKND